MRAITYLLLFAALVINTCRINAHETSMKEEKITLKTATGDIEGVLRMPESSKPLPVVLIIAGSGPTDRDGNQVMLPNNSLKLLSEALYHKGIASVCYDKRGIGESKNAATTEENMTLDDFIKDAEGWIDLLKQDKRFSEVDVLGHSEGALIGMVAADNNPNISKFVSVAGAGRKLGDILREQLANTPGIDIDITSSYIDKLEKGELIPDVQPQLYALFRPSVQPFLISCLKYNPASIIAKIKIPTLIVQGTTDIQVSKEDAKILAQAKPDAKKIIIEGMNHVLKNCDTTDRQTQISTYVNPTLPVNEKLITVTSEFIKD